MAMSLPLWLWGLGTFPAYLIDAIGAATTRTNNPSPARQSLGRLGQTAGALRTAFGTWIVRGLTQLKLHELILHMGTYNIDILCIQDTWSKNADAYEEQDRLNSIFWC